MMKRTGHLEAAPDWDFVHQPGIMARSAFYFVESMGQCNYTRTFEREDLASFLLVYTRRGRGLLRYRGRSYTLLPGSVFLINCVDYQRYGPLDGGLWEIFWLHFNGAHSSFYVDYILSTLGPVIAPDPQSDIPAHLMQIAGLLRTNDPRTDIISTSLITQILTGLVLTASTRNDFEKSIPEVVRKARLEIETRSRQDLSIDSLARAVGVSRFHLSRLYKKHTGSSPHQHLTSLRLNKAKILLRTTDLAVYQIAEEVGLATADHFIKLFHRYEKTTPHKYREVWRGRTV